VGIRPLVLLVPSVSAAVELPRRIAMGGRPLVGVYAMRVRDLARVLAEPEVLGAGLRAWLPGHPPQIASRLLGERPDALPLAPGLPRAPVAAALGRTLMALRLAGVDPSRVAALARRPGIGAEDEARLLSLGELYARFQESVEGRFSDPATLLARAIEHLPRAAWLREAQVLVAGDPELQPLEKDFLAALARVRPVRLLERERPLALQASSLPEWADAHGIARAAAADTPLAPLFDGRAVPEGLRRLRTRLFEAPEGEPVRDGSVELVTAPGEAAEVRAVVRRLLREADRGVAFEDMGVIVPRPEPYAPLFTDLLDRLKIPYRLHPSLPLRTGRCARSLLLLLRCRGLGRAAVMEFLTFAPLAVEALLGEGAVPHPAAWDEASRQAGVTSGYERWLLGLRAHAETAHAEARGADDARRERYERQARDAETLRRLVERLNLTLERLSGAASWPEWSARLLSALEEWIGTDRDRQKLEEVLAGLAGLGPPDAATSREEMEAVLEAQLEDELLPAAEPRTGGLHVGALDAIAGLPFRVVAVTGLVEGGYPGTLRPDPLLLDEEREALEEPAAAAPPPRADRPRRAGQLSLFDLADEAPLPPARASAPRSPRGPLLPTTQDRLLQERRRFHRALSQAGERLILSYPRADARTGRERMPSLFFAAAASVLAGRPLAALEMTASVGEDDLGTLDVGHAVDASERDRVRALRGGSEAVLAIASGAPFFKGSQLAARAHWTRELTPFDGRVDRLPPELARRLDPATAPWPVSASSLANYARCGYLYLLRNVLGLEPREEPEERLWLDPLEQGRLFHEVAQLFLCERRDKGELPVRDDEPARQRLLALARERVEVVIAGTPPRHRLWWQMRWRTFEDLLLKWLAREAITADRWTPTHFELPFGTRRAQREGAAAGGPLVIDLGEGETLRVAGQIDRIDTQADGSLVLRDYKTGRAPRDDGGVFRGGRELQIPIYVLATRMLFPDRRVDAAFLDYVNGGRPVAFDPDTVTGEDFKGLLRDMRRLIAEGSFVQEPSSCKWCDFTAVCGPQPLLEIRQQVKRSDPRLLRYLRLRDYR
jgi:RecB family exonuclease